MKFVRNLILALALFLPGYSLAEEDSVYTPEKITTSYTRPQYGVEIGGGSMFMAGLEWWFQPYSIIYVQKRPEGHDGLWAPDDALVWTIRSRYVYDFIDHEHGLLLNPNIQYVRFPGNIAAGLQAGYFFSTGFDYGASFRLGFLTLLNVEAGYFVRKKSFFVNAILSVSIPIIEIFDP